MNRVNYINENFNLNSISKATRYAKQLTAFNDEVLENFVNFVWSNKREYEIIDQAILRCIKDFKAILTLKSIQSNSSKFPDIETMINFIKDNFKGKDLASGIAGYMPFVIISMDKEGYLINRYTMTDYGKPKGINCDEENKIYDYLFKNQEKIGVVKHLTLTQIEEQRKIQAIALKKTQEELEAKNKELEAYKKISPMQDKKMKELLLKTTIKINERTSNAS